MERERPAGQDEREPGAPRADEREPAVGRSQNALYVLPPDAASVAQFLPPALERIDPTADAVQLLVITPDAETAVAAAAAVTRARQGVVRAIPATGAGRAARLLRDRSAPVVTGAPAQLLELIGASALKLQGVRALVIAWADAILDAGGGEALAAVMAEVPKDSARIVVAGQMTPGVEQLVERYARRPKRVGEVAPAEAEPMAMQYVTVSAASRPAALRRLLDELDPELAAVYARSDDAAVELEQALRDFGYAGEHANVRATRGEPVPGATLIMLYELPDTRSALRALTGASPGGAATGRPAPHVIALVQPRQLGALRALAAGGRVTAHTLTGPGARARGREDALRAELRAALREGAPARELLALEPLLEEFDGVELAAAALWLLEHERERAREREREREREPREREAGAASPWTRIFVGAGVRDNVSVRDLVGAISNEAGISSDNIGKVDLRDTHALVDIASAEADNVVRKLTGTVIRGRRIVARVDKGSPREGSREGGRERHREGARERGRGAGPRDAGGFGRGRGGRGRAGGPGGPANPGDGESRAARPTRPDEE